MPPFAHPVNHFFRFLENLFEAASQSHYAVFHERGGGLCSSLPGLSITFFAFQKVFGIASQSHYSVLYERGRLMLLFSNPVNHFFRLRETLFRLHVVLKSPPLRETRR